MAFRFVPDVFDGVVVGAVGRQWHEGDVRESVPVAEVLFEFSRFVPSGIVPHDRDPLVGILLDQFGQGIDDGAGVLPVQSGEFDAAVRLVEESDIGLAAALRVDLQDRGDPGAAPGLAGVCLMLDPHLVSGEHEPSPRGGLPAPGCGCGSSVPPRPVPGAGAGPQRRGAGRLNDNPTWWSSSRHDESEQKATSNSAAM